MFHAITPNCFNFQTHLVCCVPPYHRTDITETVSVQFFVRSGGKTSEPHSFYYTPPSQDTGPQHCTRHHAQGNKKCNNFTAPRNRFMVYLCLAVYRSVLRLAGRKKRSLWSSLHLPPKSFVIKLKIGTVVAVT